MDPDRKINLPGSYWSKVAVAGPDDCWKWTGYARNGCPIIWMNGRNHRAARVMFEAANGPIVEKHVVVHGCDNSLCVNPRHLKAVAKKTVLHSGDSPPGINARRTKCSNGHDLNDPKNVYIRKDGKGRQCRVCNREAVARHAERTKGRTL